MFDESGNFLRELSKSEAENKCKYCSVKKFKDFQWQPEALFYWMLFKRCFNGFGIGTWPKAGGIEDQDYDVIHAFDVILSVV